MSSIFIQQHWIAISLGSVYVVTAMVNALPDERKDFDCYVWFAHWAKQCINALPAKYQPKTTAQ